jgi:hypothetical protein
VARSTRKTLAIGTALVALTSTGMGALVFVSGSAAQAPETFTVIARLDKANFIDTERDRFPPGDYSVARFGVMDETDTSRVGTEDLHCVTVFNRRDLCKLVYSIRGRGRLIVEGIFSQTGTEPSVLAVTGGTGDFAGVGGTARFESIPGAVRVTFEVT